MSTSYAYQATQAELVEQFKLRGWTETTADTGAFAMVSPNGHYAHDFCEWDGPDLLSIGTTKWSGVTRYGGNSEVAEVMGDLEAFDEYSEEYEQAVGSLTADE